jgi:predicted GIY-YIG superfamily endonuclease
MRFYIYVLRLVNDKYYVGKAVDPEKRFEKHVNGEGARWTRRYKPLEMIETYPSDNPFDEDKTTKEYMAKYGIENVRGGSYVTKKIPEDQKQFIQKEIWMALNMCTKCGGKHLSRFCNSE